MNTNIFILLLGVVCFLGFHTTGCSHKKLSFDVENNASLGSDRLFESQVGVKTYREHIDTSVVFLLKREGFEEVKESEFEKMDHLWISIITDSLEIKELGYNPALVDEVIISTRP